MLKTLTLTTFTLAFLLAAGASAQSVFVVAPVPGAGVFSTDIQTAINAAVDGDLVLVKGGSYPGFTINAKSISIVADTGASVVTNGQVFVSNLAASQSLLLQGITVLGNSSVPSLLTLNSPGPIWIESCNVTGGTRSASGLVAVSINSCPSVVIQRSIMIGGSGAPGGTTDMGAPGLHVANSTVSVSDSQCVGGNGAHTTTGGPNAGIGGSGMRIVTGSVFASGTAFKGGNGAAPAPPFPGGAAGPGIHTTGAVAVFDCTLTVGHSSPNFPLPPPIVVVGAGTAQTLPGVARHFVTTTPVREGQTATITASGVAGELTGFLFSASPGPLFLMLPLDGALALPAGNADWFALGTIPPNGTLSSQLVVPNLPATLQQMTFWCQSVFYDAQLTNIVIGPASAIVVLDSAF